MPAQYTLHNGYFPQFYCMPIIFRLWRLSGSPGLSGPTLASSSSWLIWRIRSPRGSPGSADCGIPHIIVLTVTSRISLSGPWHPCVIVYHCPDCGIPRIIVRCADCGIPYTPGLCERNSENYYTLLNRHLFCLAYRVHGGPQKKLRSTRVFQLCLFLC